MNQAGVSAFPHHPAGDSQELLPPKKVKEASSLSRPGGKALARSSRWSFCRFCWRFLLQFFGESISVLLRGDCLTNASRPRVACAPAFGPGLQAGVLRGQLVRLERWWCLELGCVLFKQEVVG